MLSFVFKHLCHIQKERKKKRKKKKRLKIEAEEREYTVIVFLFLSFPDRVSSWRSAPQTLILSGFFSNDARTGHWEGAFLSWGCGTDFAQCWLLKIPRDTPKGK